MEQTNKEDLQAMYGIKNAYALHSKHVRGGQSQPLIVAMRGRNPDNPSDRTPGIETEQRLEPNTNGTANTITSVQKDNLVLERLLS